MSTETKQERREMLDADRERRAALRTVPDPEMPAWLPGIADRAVHSGQSDLMQRMLDAGEDITDTELWKHRREQFMTLLADRAAER